MPFYNTICRRNRRTLTFQLKNTGQLATIKTHSMIENRHMTREKQLCTQYLSLDNYSISEEYYASLLYLYKWYQFHGNTDIGENNPLFFQYKLIKSTIKMHSVVKNGMFVQRKQVSIHRLFGYCLPFEEHRAFLYPYTTSEVQGRSKENTIHSVSLDIYYT